MSFYFGLIVNRIAIRQGVFLTATFGQGSRSYFVVVVVVVVVGVVGVGVQTFIEFCQISLDKGQNGSSWIKLGANFDLVQYFTLVQFQTRCNFHFGAILGAIFQFGTAFIFV